MSSADCLKAPRLIETVNPAKEHAWLRQVMVASTSLLALSFTFGGAGAQVTHTCGAPVSGVANCTGVSYPSGIEYEGYDDLSVVVGAPAGQTAPVAVGGMIGLHSSEAAQTSQTLYVGDNVTITSGTHGVWVDSYAYSHETATAHSVVTNEADVNAADEFPWGSGILVYANADAVGVASSETGAAAVAEVFVNNWGTIVTGGSWGASGIEAHADAVASNPDNAHADYAEAYILVQNAGNISTIDDLADAVAARAHATGYGVGEVDTVATGDVENQGALTTSGDFANGIFVAAAAYGYNGNSTALADAYNNGSITTTGDGAVGIRIDAAAKTQSPTTATATAMAVNTKAITTHGDGAEGIVLQSAAQGGGFETMARSDVTNSGAIVTSGDFAGGIDAVSQTTGTAYYAYAVATARNSAAITTSGLDADAIGAVSYAGADAAYVVLSSAGVTNSGAIIARGDTSAGILASATALGSGEEIEASASVGNTAAVTTSGDAAPGIGATADAAAPAGVEGLLSAASSVDNKGAIVTSGDGSGGILVDASASGSVPAGDYIVADSEVRANASAANTAAVRTAGMQSAAIAVNASAALDVGGGIVETGEETVDTFGATVAVTNSGALTTSGASSGGISAGSKINLVVPDGAEVGPVFDAAASTTVTNSGAIRTSGSSANGIDTQAQVYLHGAEADTTAQVAVTNSGAIRVTGDESYGIVARAALFSVQDEAALEAMIAQGDEGIDPGTTVTVTNSASVVASGAHGVGVAASAFGVTIQNLAGGAITGGSGQDAAGVAADGHIIAITNWGAIGSGNDFALQLNDSVGYPGGGTITLDNRAGATITGFVHAFSGNTQFTNSGTWTARGGDSNFKPSTGGSSVVVNHGTVLAVGSQRFLGLSRFENTGLLSLSSVTANAGTRPAFETLEITGDFVGGTGSILELGTNMTTTADVLKVDGAITGSTTFRIDRLGEPGLTTGNGILLVDATAGTTSAGNFTMVSNSAGGTYVAGAFEYSLSQVPATAGHGAWYLASKLYPGTPQFAQIGSAALAVANLAGESLPDLMSSTAMGGDTASNDKPVRVASLDNAVPGRPVKPATFGAWGRYNYASLDVSPSGSSFADYHLDASVGHFGIDTTVYGKGMAGTFGIAFHPVDASADFDNFGSSHEQISGYGTSLYAMLASGNWRTGLEITGDHLKIHFTDQYIGTNAKVRISGFGVQGLVSYTADFSGVLVEPMGSLSYTTLGGGSFVDGAGDRVTFGATESMLGKFSLRVGEAFNSEGVVLKPYVDLGVSYEYAGKTHIAIGSYADATDVRGAMARTGGGLVAEFGDSLSVFGNAAYISGSRESGWTGYVGLRYSL